MPDPVTAIIVGGATLGGAYLQSRGAQKGAKAQVEAAGIAAGVQREMFYVGREDVAPWRKAGEWALERIKAAPRGFVPEEQPGYRFGYEEFVEKPTLRMASATGRLGSGATQRALTRYAQDYASGQYQSYLDRYYRLAGLGQVSAGQQAQNALLTGRGLAESTLAGGQARASGYEQQGNIWGGAASSMGQNVLDYYLMNKMGLFGSAPTPTYSTPTSSISPSSYYGTFSRGLR